MKHTFTNEEIQAAIDVAYHPKTRGQLVLVEKYYPSGWPAEAPARLALARGLLASLPEPQPPTADGKTPGQVCHESMYNTPEWKWLLAGDKAACEAAASAVLAAFGGDSLEQAIARMEAVPLQQLAGVFRTHYAEAGATEIRARMIAAAREGHGPAAEDWKAKFNFWNQRCLEKERDILLQQDRAEKAEVELAHRGALWANQVSTIQKLRAQLEELEANPQLSTLRPIAEAGKMPAGAVRVFATWTGARWIITTTQTVDTHFADILLPETKAPEPISGLEGLTKDRCMKLAKLGEDHTISAGDYDVCQHATPHTYCETCKVSPCPIGLSLPEVKAPAVESAKPAKTFTAHGKTWNVHVPGDPMPKTGGRQIETLFNDGSGSTGSVETWAWQTTKYPPKGWRYADEPTTETEIFVNGAGNPVFPPSAPWTPAVGDVVTKANPVQDMALGGQMYWRDLARQLAEVWWKCHTIGASLQHGDIDTDISFSVVCEKHGGQCFHADTPHNAWLKAEKWLRSPDRENFPTATLQPA